LFLQIGNDETAAEIFASEVVDKVPQSLRGLARITALTDAFLQHLERRIFPGGCFFATVAAQLAANPGRPRDRVMQVQTEWVAQFTSALDQSRADGEIPRDADVEQLAFEITAMMLRANFAWVLTGDKDVLDQARAGVKNVLSRVAQAPESHGKRRPPGKK
jgi:hypothetical protein